MGMLRREKSGFELHDEWPAAGFLDDDGESNADPSETRAGRVCNTSTLNK